MHSPFFFKQNFYLPTETNAAKNAANVKYIATRPVLTHQLFYEATCGRSKVPCSANSGQMCAGMRFRENQPEARRFWDRFSQ
jgi:hypothetical protein